VHGLVFLHSGVVADCVTVGRGVGIGICVGVSVRGGWSGIVLTLVLDVGSVGVADGLPVVCMCVLLSLCVHF